MNKNKILVVILIITTLVVGFKFSNEMLFGNEKANITIEKVGKSNIYDFKFNVDTNDNPIFAIQDNVGVMEIGSFWESIMGYNNANDLIYFNKEVKFKEGITVDLELEDGTVLIIKNGLIIGVR